MLARVQVCVACLCASLAPPPSRALARALSRVLALSLSRFHSVACCVRAYVVCTLLHARPSNAGLHAQHPRSYSERTRWQQTGSTTRCRAWYVSACLPVCLYQCLRRHCALGTLHEYANVCGMCVSICVCLSLSVRARVRVRVRACACVCVCACVYMCVCLCVCA